MNYLIPFVILITVVVFIHEYGHYYFAKKYGVGFLAGMINLAPDGKFAGYRLEVM